MVVVAILAMVVVVLASPPVALHTLTTQRTWLAKSPGSANRINALTKAWTASAVTMLGAAARILPSSVPPAMASATRDVTVVVVAKAVVD